MTIPYSRPPAVKAPSVPSFKPGGALWGGLVPKANAPVSTTVAANDQFTLPYEYKPGTLQQTAQTGYNTDVQNDNKLATMGTTPDASIAADYAQRASNEQGIYQALQQQLAGIQTAQVSQGNAGSAALGAQNAAIGAPAGILPTTGAQAVLGANTAATGNYGGSLQAAALSAGAQAQKSTLDAGTLAQTTNDQDVQKNLASLLSGLTPVSTRLTAEQTANQGVDAANVQTGLTLYTADEAAKSAAITAGNKKAYDQATLDEKRDYDHASNTTKLAIDKQNNATKVTTTTSNNATKLKTAQAAAAAKTAAAKTAAAAKIATTGAANPTQKRQQLTAAIRIINTTGGTKTTEPTTYTVKVQPPTPTVNGKVIPGTATPSSTSVPVSAADYASGAWKAKLPKGYTAISAPVVAKTTTATVNKPGSYTRYNRGASYLKANNWTPAEIKAALKQYHP